MTTAHSFLYYWLYSIFIFTVHYTTSCNTQSSAPEDGRDHRPKHVELIGIINKPLLLHLVGVYTIYIRNGIHSVLSYFKREKCWQWRKKIPYKTSYFFHSFAFYTDDSCRIIQVNKDLRTLNNVTGLFEGGYVRSGWQDATDIVVKTGPAGDLFGCAKFPVTGCCRRRIEPMDYLDGGD